MSKKTTPLIGAHLSISDGFAQAIRDGESIGCTAIQIFTKSNRQWQTKPISEADAATFKKTLAESSIRTVNVHASYLINLGSPDSAIAHRSTEALTTEILRCEQLGIPYLVLHPGASLDSNEADCLDQIAANLDKALENAPGNCMVLLENMAGQGTVIGYNFEQLATIRKKSHQKKRVGFCFDTCHAFAAGYDFRDKESYEAMWQEIDQIIGREHIKIIHVNDSQKDLDSHVDRHTDIGKGKLGLEAFALLMNDKHFKEVPKILETPKTSLKDDARNLETLISLIK